MWDVLRGERERDGPVTGHRLGGPGLHDRSWFDHVVA